MGAVRLENRGIGGAHHNFSTFVSPQGQHGTTTPGTPQNTSIIIIGVVVPLVLIAIAGFIFYIWYRRKYPVRMIVGKDFNHFTNPKFDKRASTLTLVRHPIEDNAGPQESSEYTHQELTIVSETENDITNEEYANNTPASQTRNISKLSSDEDVCTHTELVSTSTSMVRERPRPKKAVLVKTDDFDEFCDGFEMVTENDLGKRTDSELSSGNDSVDTRTISFKETFSGSSGSLDFVSENQGASQDEPDIQSSIQRVDEARVSTPQMTDTQSTTTNSICSVETSELMAVGQSQSPEDSIGLILNKQSSIDNETSMYVQEDRETPSGDSGNTIILSAELDSKTNDITLESDIACIVRRDVDIVSFAGNLKQDRNDSVFIERDASSNHLDFSNTQLQGVINEANTTIADEIKHSVTSADDSNPQNEDFDYVMNNFTGSYVETSCSGNQYSINSAEADNMSQEDISCAAVSDISNENSSEQNKKNVIIVGNVMHEEQLKYTSQHVDEDENVCDNVKHETCGEPMIKPHADYILPQTEAYCITVEEPNNNIEYNKCLDDESESTERSESANTNAVDTILVANLIEDNTLNSLRPTLSLSTENVYLDNAPPSPMVIVQDSIIFEPCSASPVLLDANDSGSIGKRMSFNGFESMSSSITSDNMFTGATNKMDTTETDFRCVENAGHVQKIEVQNNIVEQISGKQSLSETADYNSEQSQYDLKLSDKDNRHEQLKLDSAETISIMHSPSLDLVLSDIESERKGDYTNEINTNSSETIDDNSVVINNSKIEETTVIHETGVETMFKLEPSSLNMLDDSHSIQSSMELSIDHYSNSFIKASTPTPSSAEDKGATVYSFDNVLDESIQHTYVEQEQSVFKEMTHLYEGVNAGDRKQDSENQSINSTANSSNVYDLINASEMSASVDSSALSWELVSENISLSSDNIQDGYNIVETEHPNDTFDIGKAIFNTIDENTRKSTNTHIVTDHTVDDIGESATGINVLEGHNTPGKASTDADLSWDVIDDDASSC